LDESSVNRVPGYIVAFKTTDASHGDGANDLEFEATVMAQVGMHDNLVSLIGVVTVGVPLLLVVSYCEHGSLLTVLRKHAGNDRPMDLGVKLRLAHQTTLGMAHLSSRHFIHRDLAARNILVASGMVAKVADFGLSRSSVLDGGNEKDGGGQEYYRSKHGVFAVRWTAPEAMEKSRFTQASDVWSFGVVMVELLQDGAVPYGLWTTQYVMMKVVGGHNHEKPAKCPNKLYSMMLECWQFDPRERPLFSSLATLLESPAIQQLNGGEHPGRDGSGSGGGYLVVTTGDLTPIVNCSDELAPESSSSGQFGNVALDGSGYVADNVALDGSGYVVDNERFQSTPSAAEAAALPEVQLSGGIAEECSRPPRGAKLSARTTATTSRTGISRRSERKGSTYLGFEDDEDGEFGTTRM
jgi:serine/threonine protein kinase